MKLELKVSESGRVDLILLDELKRQGVSCSRAKLKDYFQAGEICLGSKKLAPSLLLSPGHYAIEIPIEKIRELQARARASLQGSFVPVVFENEEVLVLHKPSGVPSVPQSAEETETAVGSALAQSPSLPENLTKPLEPGILHRLDTLTSGLLIFAKTSESFLRLKDAWKKNEVRKTYRALVQSEGPILLPSQIDLNLAHDASTKKRMIALKSPTARNFRGKPLPALTLIQGSRRIPDTKTVDLTLEIKTGVMHQIRCHLAALHYPIIGDPIYQGVPSPRLWLHAWQIELPLSQGKRLKLEAALPDGWGQAR